MPTRFGSKKEDLQPDPVLHRTKMFKIEQRLKPVKIKINPNINLALIQIQCILPVHIDSMLRVVFFLVTVLILTSCLDRKAKEEYTAQKYCGSCHTMPSPQLLPKKTWKKNVLPQMAFRMGLEYFLMKDVPEADQNAVLSSLPPKAMLSQEEWQLIKNYFLTNAPDSLQTKTIKIKDTLKTFSAKGFSFGGNPSMITLLKYDSEKQMLIAGTRHNQFIKMKLNDFSFNSHPLKSPVSFYNRIGEEEYLLLMGIMDPNDQKKGNIQLNAAGQASALIDSLKRPVHFAMEDLNKDGLEDLIVCEFGNYTGELSAFKNLGNKKYQKYTLISLPGARKVDVIDWNKDGLKDIVVLMTQGDEKIMVLKNLSDFNFSPITLARFPSVYGSSYFEIHDINKDGNPDIIYCNGDNADYSILLKPYHGIRILMNNGHGQLDESWFYHMDGASQFRAVDFDKDGDLDIAAISFFPDFDKTPEQSFIYFENKEGNFEPKIIPQAVEGRWLVMEVADFNQDGFEDIVLGALNFNEGVPEKNKSTWREHPVDLLFLENHSVNSNHEAHH